MQIAEYHSLVDLEDEVRVLAREKCDISHGHKELLHSTRVTHDLELKTSVQDVKETEHEHYVDVVGQ
jgi:hypothetical protein